METKGICINEFTFEKTDISSLKCNLATDPYLQIPDAWKNVNLNFVKCKRNVCIEDGFFVTRNRACQGIDDLCVPILVF